MGLHPAARSPFISSLNQVGGECLVFVSIAGDDFHDGDVSSRNEANQPHQADGEVFEFYVHRQIFLIENNELQQGRKDECQEAAADRPDQ